MALRFERLIRIYNRLRRGPVTIEIINNWAKSAGILVSERQLYRDLNELQNLKIAAGENVVAFIDEKNRKTWKLEYEANNERLTQFDINSFFLFKNFVPYAVYEQRKSSMEKFENIIYKNFSKNKYQQHIQANELYLRRTNYNENLYSEIEHNKIEDLIWALQNKRIIVIEKEYLNVANIKLQDNSFPISLYPMELVFHRGRVHISGLSENKTYLLFTIDKSLKFRLTNNTFNRKSLLSTYQKLIKPLFGISDSTNKKVFNVKIEFTQGYGESFKSFYWHSTQKWKQLKSGNYMLQLKCTIGRELIGFLTMGLDKVKVHQPAVLKSLIIKKHKLAAMVNENNLTIDEEKANEDY